jgi:DNA-binding transcriptional ArsR family regulator
MRLMEITRELGIEDHTKVVFHMKLLREAGIIERVRDGRRNRYRLSMNCPLRHPVEAHRSVGSLLATILDTAAMKRLSDSGGAAAP